jgi:very-short-patch-repair endonuclease
VTHNGKQSCDKRRENRLRELGFNILRLDGYYVLKNITGALELSMGCIEEIGKTHPPQSPLNRGAGSDSPFEGG